MQAKEERANQSASAHRRASNGQINKLSPEDRAAHNWYRFVLSFPPHLVRHYLEQFEITPAQCVLDPFCGTGTTLVECKKSGIPSLGIEANRMPYFASQVKVDWHPDPALLRDHATKVADAARAILTQQGIEDHPVLIGFNRKEPSELLGLPPDTAGLLLTNSISPLPLHKALVLLDCIRNEFDPAHSNHELLAFAKALVDTMSNLHFGPEVGVGPAKPDAPALAAWLDYVLGMAQDLAALKAHKEVPATIHHADARKPLSVLEPNSIDAVITSPPYPNEKDYTRTTRLESVLLGFIKDRDDLQSLKRQLLRSNTRNVYRGDDDDLFISEHTQIQSIAAAIEARRIELGKTSGFEKLYAKVTKLYFGGMLRHLADLRSALRPGAHLAYVVGDQASYLRVMIRTGQLLADIAQSLGYELVNIDLFRTRLATATKEQLREEVVVLRWPGRKTTTI